MDKYIIDETNNSVIIKLSKITEDKQGIVKLFKIPQDIHSNGINYIPREVILSCMLYNIRDYTCVSNRLVIVSRKSLNKICNKYKYKLSRYCLLMPICECDLSQINIERDELSDICFDVIECVANVHSLGLIHNDIKPSNFFIKDNKVLIGDFGNCIPLYELSSPCSNGYRSFEYHLCESITDMCSDVWSIGATLYRLITDKELYNDNNVFQVIFSSTKNLSRTIKSLEQYLKDVKHRYGIDITNALTIINKYKSVKYNNNLYNILSQYTDDKELINVCISCLEPSPLLRPKNAIEVINMLCDEVDITSIPPLFTVNFNKANNMIPEYLLNKYNNIYDNRISLITKLYSSIKWETLHSDLSSNGDISDKTYDLRLISCCLVMNEFISIGTNEFNTLCKGITYSDLKYISDLEYHIIMSLYDFGNGIVDNIYKYIISYLL